MNSLQYHEITNYLADIISHSQFTGQLFAVGGCCRDELLSADIKDIDLAVSLPDGGIQFAKWLEKNQLTKGKVVVFPQYNTARFTLKAFPKMEMECVQTRKEKYTDPHSRNPITAFGSIEDDSLRRDLTINSLYWDISNHKLLDITGYGVSDIKNHLIRTPANPDIIYDDDPLRILRCIRFASRYNWEIEPETFAGLLRNVPRLEIITKERIRDEFDKMISGPNPVTALKLLRSTGAMHFIIPELEDTYEAGQNQYHFGTVWEHTLKVMEKIESPSLEVRLGALLHDIGKPPTRMAGPDGRIHFITHELAGAKMVPTIMQRLKYSAKQINQVSFLVKNHMRTMQFGPQAEELTPKRLRKLQYICGSEKRFEELLAVIDADNQSVALEYCQPLQVSEIKKQSAILKNEGTALFTWKPPFSGQEIMAIKELKPGPAIKECLDYLLKLAFVNPQRSQDEWLKVLKGFRLNHQADQ